MLKTSSILEKMKWVLTVWVLLLMIINYYALKDVLDNTLFICIDNFAKSTGYNFSLKEPISEIFKLAPSIPIIGFVISISNKNLNLKVKKFYNRINIIHLLLYSFLLPILLYIQNLFYGNHIMESNKFSNICIWQKK